jgi:hypothetical protein
MSTRPTPARTMSVVAGGVPSVYQGTTMGLPGGDTA